MSLYAPLIERSCSCGAARQRHLLHNPRQQRPVTRPASTGLQVDAAVDVRIDSTPYIGPIQAVNVDGAGRGVVVTRDVAPGELLLCCHPLAVVTGPQQHRLTVDQLQVQLATNISPAVTAWLDELYDGTEKSMLHVPDFQAAAAVQQQQQAQARLLQSLREQQQQLAQRDPTSSSDVQLQVTDALLQHIMDVVRYNAYSDLHDDLAAAAATGQEPVSLIGLYPEFSFFNHSCVPNCINWVLPGEPRAMVVRAARHIPSGHQATISYLGAPQLLPLSGRRQALDNFGFNCRCSRCIAEEEVASEVADLLDDIVSRVYQSFTPRLQAAVADDDVAAAAEVRRQATSMMIVLYSQFRRHLIRPQARLQLLASCFSCLELIADAAAVEGDRHTEAHALHKCLEAAAAVTPGSDLHCIIAAKLEAVLARSSSSSSSSVPGSNTDSSSSNDGGGGADVMAQHASAGTDQAAHPLGKDGVIGNGVQGSTPNNSSSAHSDVGAGVTPPSSDSSGNSAGGTVNDGLSEAAMQACTAAHQARYGHLPQHQLQELVVLNRTLYV